MPKDQNYKHTLRCRISTDMRDRLANIVKRDDRNESEHVRDALREYVNRQEGNCRECGKPPGGKAFPGPYAEKVSSMKKPNPRKEAGGEDSSGRASQKKHPH